MTIIDAVQGDIATVAADAVVNPAHHALRGSDGGVDHAIHAAGGPAILLEAIERYPDGLVSGDTGWTTAGDLPARWVLHTVVPNVQEAHGGRRLLEACYRGALELADELGARTVAVPLLGTGALGWDVSDSLAAALDAVTGTDTAIDRVLLVSTKASHHRAEVALFQATPLRILQAVRVLHRRGYHRLRATPGMSGSGMYWRVTIASTDNDDGEAGFVDPKHAIFYSTGGLTEFAGGRVDGATSPRRTADLILAALPHLEPTFDDPAYAQWYEGLLRLVEREHSLPVSYADYFDHAQGWEIGWCSGLRYPEPPAAAAVARGNLSPADPSFSATADPIAGEDTWYAKLSEQWKPEHVRLLLIGESAPDDGGDPTNRRFFYAPELTAKDALFRSVVHAELGVPHLDSKTQVKRPWLEQLRDRGVFLIDLVPYPVNGLNLKARSEARVRSVGDCVDRSRALNPDGIIVCHTPSFNVLRQPLMEAGLPLLHDGPIPFPLGNWHSKFVDRYRRAVEQL